MACDVTPAARHPASHYVRYQRDQAHRDKGNGAGAALDTAASQRRRATWSWVASAREPPEELHVTEPRSGSSR